MYWLFIFWGNFTFLLFLRARILDRKYCCLLLSFCWYGAQWNEGRLGTISPHQLHSGQFKCEGLIYILIIFIFSLLLKHYLESRVIYLCWMFRYYKVISRLLSSYLVILHHIYRHFCLRLALWRCSLSGKLRYLLNTVPSSKVSFKKPFSETFREFLLEYSSGNFLFFCFKHLVHNDLKCWRCVLILGAPYFLWCGQGI